MRKLVSVLLTLAFVSVVPALAAAELSVPESCCAPGGDGMMVGMSCCAMPSCSMSPSRNEPVRSPNHRATTTESGQKVPAPKPVVTTVPSLDAPPATSVETAVELLDPSPPPTTSERLAVISCYLI